MDQDLSGDLGAFLAQTLVGAVVLLLLVGGGMLCCLIVSCLP